MGRDVRTIPGGWRCEEEKETPSGARVHQGVDVRKSERYLMQQKGSWFKVEIQTMGKSGMFWDSIVVFVFCPQ